MIQIVKLYNIISSYKKDKVIKFVIYIFIIVFTYYSSIMKIITCSIRFLGSKLLVSIKLVCQN